MPPDFHDATAADYPSYAALQPELGTGDPVPDLAHWLEDYAPTTLIATVAGEIVGYAYYQLLSGVGYVRNVVVAPAHRHKGHGRALMDEIARRFRAAGASEWCLNVKPENAAAIALYRAVGMAKAYDSAILRMGWDALERLPAEPGIAGLLGGAGLRAGGQPPSRIVAREVRPDEDEAVRSAFDLLPGQLAEVRQHAARRVLGLFEGTAPRGVAALNLSFGSGLGSFPFRVSRPELARNLLDAMRAYAGPEHVWAQVVIDGDPPLVERLLAAGAVVRMQIEYHRGRVPQGRRSVSPS